MTKLLLCGVFQAIWSQGRTSEPLYTMELLNNQVTREQGNSLTIQQSEFCALSDGGKRPGSNNRAGFSIVGRIQEGN